MTTQFFKVDPFNFVPILKTPWGGTQISLLKKTYFPEFKAKIPDFIGESWEISTDKNYPSLILMNGREKIPLTDLLQQNSSMILGEKIANKYGAHSPLLLKWLHAKDNLSVQLHPKNGNPLLNESECGKPESWLVLNVEKNGYVYLGFKPDLSKEEIIENLLKDDLEKCLNKYYPKMYDYISVPPGCVHAVGPGVFLAEPQYVLPKKSGKTWRISDWKRLYDENGKLSAYGKPRELHVKESLGAIDWNLPRGKELEKLLIQQMENGKIFLGNTYNPFSLQIFYNTQKNGYTAIEKDSFTLATVWAGEVTLETKYDSITLQGGESLLISADVKSLSINMIEKYREQPKIAFFALNDEVI
ncbi:class I mannose-6-phosphate isomerase [Pigmentibacter sp. JX0631]|uniref:type I phosphomannose isomerase catalytic subunit n=1 Tax=Pigmentibacter sp. JX0631 TaxID=2976982 RepID=UPI0024682D61|nr:type I phosphomannose isomerase catalytic subunit [Pigmentibacter sp. JX0631]WGL58934.1 class I mannose-6-phosphate isomerase [Pigmentibacter sp. JX0631]